MGPWLRLSLCSQSLGVGSAGNAVHKRFPLLKEVKEHHAHSEKGLNDHPIYKANKLMHLYVKRGNMVDARHAFENMPNRNVVSWNILILGYANQEEAARALELYAQMHWEGVQPSERTFVGALKACSSPAALKGKKQVDKTGCLAKGRAIHSQVVQRGFDTDVFVGNTLVNLYAKSGSMEEARHVFDELPYHDVVTCNTMILGYAEQEDCALSFELYAQMCQDGITADHRTFVGMLKACSTLAALEEGRHGTGSIMLVKGRALHSQVVKSGFESNVFVGTSLVDMYAKFGCMKDAQCAFDKLSDRNVVTWTTMILGYAEREHSALALKLYTWMHKVGVTADQRTFVGALTACSSLTALEERKQDDEKVVKTGCLVKGRAIHFQIVKSGLEYDIFVGNTLVNMYAKCGSMEDARHVFDNLPQRDVVTWNTMILGYTEQEDSAMALELYSRMHQEGATADQRSFVGALKACSGLAALKEGNQAAEGEFGKIGYLVKGRAIHFQIIKSSFELDVFVGTVLVNMYAKCGSMEDAQCVFDKLQQRDVVTWTTMILGYAEQENSALALEFYVQMHKEGIGSDQHTFVGALKACSSLAALEVGKQVGQNSMKIGCLEKGRAIHSQIVKSDFEADVFVGTNLVNIYAKCGAMEDARRVFDELPDRNVVTWTNMILGYAEQEESKKAFSLYARMKEQALSPSSFTFVATLKACGNTATLETGKELHSQLLKVGFETIAIVATSLIDMYSKCGSMVDAQWLFDTFPTRNILLWSALIAGYARQGESELVFHLFERLKQEGIQPDGITFLSILTVCSHVGLVDEGWMYFKAVSQQHGIIPNIEHYTCMVDLLARAGQVAEAVAMVEKMPFQPNAVVWLTMLGACQRWKDVEIGRNAFENVMRSNENLSVTYVLMTNLYAVAYIMQEDCDKIQVMRKITQ